MTTIASRFGWSWCFVAIAAIAAVSLALLAWRTPAGLHTPTVDLKAWRELFRDRLVLQLLLITVLQMTGQFVIFTFVGPLLTQIVGAGPDAISLAFALYGIGGFLGNLAATQVVGRLGAFRTSLVSTGSVSAGIAIWAAGAGLYPLMIGGIFVWGLGFAAANSMQQARLAAAAPEQAGSAVALNTSALYVGQALGSALGSALFVHGHVLAMGYVALAVIVAALAAIVWSRPVT
jgi:MFS transporter, DHA1 family, inner membrane transport protein